MMFRLRPSHLAAACLVLAPVPALAISGGTVSTDPNGLRASVVQIESSQGDLCSGAVIAPDLVLTAAHCVLTPAAYRVTAVDRRFRRIPVRALVAAVHPGFVLGTTPREQPGVDLAVVRLARPLGRDFRGLNPGRAGLIRTGEVAGIAGFGVTAEGQRGSARILRQARLRSLGPITVANRVVAMADPARRAITPGAGACRGDSGAPIVRGAAGRYQLLGIVSWSSGALRSAGTTACGGITAVTPVVEHTDWIASRSDALRRYVPRGGSTVPAQVVTRAERARLAAQQPATGPYTAYASFDWATR